MHEPLPTPDLLNEWLKWAQWSADPDRDASQSGDLIGFDEFDWVVRERPEQAWQAIVTASLDPRVEPHFGVLAAGPLEDLLSQHGPNFIDRVEAEARSNPKFAFLLGGVWRLGMTDDVWARVQQAWIRKGWDGL